MSTPQTAVIQHTDVQHSQEAAIARLLNSDVFKGAAARDAKLRVFVKRHEDKKTEDKAIRNVLSRFGFKEHTVFFEPKHIRDYSVVEVPREEAAAALA